MCVYMYVCMYMYIHIYYTYYLYIVSRLQLRGAEPPGPKRGRPPRGAPVLVGIYLSIYIYIYREREREIYTHI